MTEVRLIDANALKARLRGCVIIMPNGEKCMADRAIDTQRTIEAEPVRHGRWISCSERLPEIKVPVLVTVYNHRINSYVRKIGAFLGDEWLISNIYSETIGNVIAWMPLPNAYEPPESEVHNNANQ